MYLSFKIEKEKRFPNVQKRFNFDTSKFVCKRNNYTYLLHAQAYHLSNQ